MWKARIPDAGHAFPYLGFWSRLRYALAIPRSPADYTHQSNRLIIKNKNTRWTEDLQLSNRKTEKPIFLTTTFGISSRAGGGGDGFGHVAGFACSS
jgi:hypothetical protein